MIEHPKPTGDGYDAVCRFGGCDWTEHWPTRIQARAAAVWHVHDAHRDYWTGVIGDRPPVDPRPNVARWS